MHLKRTFAFGLLITLSWAGKSPGAPDKSGGNAHLPLVGRVAETINSGSYTYILVEHGTDRTWAASQAFVVAVGDSVRIPEGWVMKDFKSQTLNRIFAWILFSPRVEVNGKGTTTPPSPLPPGHPPLPTTKPSDLIAPSAPTKPSDAPAPGAPAEIRIGSIPKVTGGYTVEECYTRVNELAGSTIKVRGVIVKYTSAILGKNWVHIRDGSGVGGTNDLLLTTTTPLKLGDTMVFEGKLARDRDFGSGYKYAVLLEDAAVSK